MNEQNKLNVEDLEKAIKVDLQSHKTNVEIPISFDNALKRIVSYRYTPKKKKKGKK
ncbi:hypothetical protein [uncultured Parabacteroides sp.]|uniref:hypothetical protein n=1 Tax=uncultured Parabacteroides sp. TaxID=512312 RepID=UPI0025E3F3DF|nr:hypothetical protein [uncultured Parabacteroides sp.]